MAYELTNTAEFLTALQRGQISENEEVRLGSKINIATAIQAIATALQSGQCPQGLQIRLWENNIGDAGAQALATALQSGKCPQGLQIGLWKNNISAVGIQAIATALQSGQCPEGLQIKLGNNDLSDAGVQIIANALQSGQCPQRLQIHLMSNNIGAAGAQALATVLQSGQCPDGLQINLGANQIGTAGTQALATALQSGKCPQGLQIRLWDNNIGDAGAQALATTLQSRQCPQGLQLDLHDNQIGAAGAQAIATALQSGQCLPGLYINLWRNNIGVDGAQAIATALQSGQCPPGLQINISNNNIGDAGAQAIATALQFGRCPEQLQIDFELNNINDIGAQAIATALQSGQCPHGLQLHLNWNNIGDASVQAIAQAILSGKCPLGLCLYGVTGLNIHLKTALTTLLHSIGNLSEVGASSSCDHVSDTQKWPAIFNALRGVLCFNPDIILADPELKQTMQTIAKHYIYSCQTQEDPIKEKYQLIAQFLLAMCEVPYVEQGSSNTDNLITHVRSVLNNCLTPQASPEAASSSDNPPNDNQDWPHVLSLIHGIVYFNVHLIFADEQLRQTIQAVLEHYIVELQTHSGELNKDDYCESYFPAFNEVAKVILAMYETSQTATAPQKQWVSTLMLTLEGSLLPQHCIDWPAGLSLWAKAQQLILIEKAFSLYLDNPTVLARHWQDFCDEFNAVPLDQRRFEQGCEVNSIKEKAENAMAIEYYYQTRANGLFVLPNLNPSPLEKRECGEAKPASAAGSAKTNFFKEAQESDEETNLEPKRQKRLSS